MKFLILALVAMGAIACERFEDEWAIFDAFNSSPHDIGVKVLGNSEVRVRAGQSMRFKAEILVPHNPVGVVSGPSTVDKQVTVDVAVRNLVTGNLHGIQCQSGAKVISAVHYEIRIGGFESVYCRANYGY